MSKNRRFLPVDDAQAPFFAGVDVGGTNIKIGVVDNEGQTVAYHSMPTEDEKGPDDGAYRMADAVLKMVRRVGIAHDEFPRVGLAAPGTMDVPNGMLLEPHNLPGWWHCPIRDMLSHHCGRPVTFANDANAAAYGEYWAGTGKQYKSMILLTLGTGIGGGIIVEGDLIVGKHSCGGEVGHIIIDCRDDAMEDNARKRGSLEAYASAGGVIKRAQAALDSGQKSSINSRLKKGEELTPLVIAQEAEKDDKLARQIVLETAQYIGVGIASLAHTVDPESAVLGGAMTFGGNESPLGRAFIQTVRDEFDRRSLGSLKGKLHIDFASLGGDAGYIGAAGLARIEHLKEISAQTASSN
ncbi:MAG: ROK family protein [Pirellulales bacterium]|nr:ROK family protein [Pirellulales bacterium]